MAGAEIPRDGANAAGAVDGDGAAPNLDDVLALPAQHAPHAGRNAPPPRRAPANGGNAHAAIAGPGFNIDEALEGPPLRRSQVGPFFIFF